MRKKAAIRHYSKVKVATRRPQSGRSIALGAGAGMIFGAAFGDPGFGMIFGAAFGLAFDALVGETK